MIYTYPPPKCTHTVVVHEYRHRFLWWRWGAKGYHVKVINHNPHSTLLYKRFVKKE